jgi:hypothetical protein
MALLAASTLMAHRILSGHEWDGFIDHPNIRVTFGITWDSILILQKKQLCYSSGPKIGILTNHGAHTFGQHSWPGGTILPQQPSSYTEYPSWFKAIYSCLMVKHTRYTLGLEELSHQEETCFHSLARMILVPLVLLLWSCTSLGDQHNRDANVVTLSALRRSVTTITTTTCVFQRCMPATCIVSMPPIL